jgi:rSAM/selenodomain-associated transferase 1
MHCIAVFLRAPESGKVKTRLAKYLGVETVLELYHCFVQDTLNAAEKTGNDIKIFYHPPDSETALKNWLEKPFKLYPQKGEDLGKRMANAFSDIFSSGYRKAVLIGTDCPDIRENTLEEAFQGLENSGCAVGPSVDGGYYLIGFEAGTFSKKLFDNIAWGTDSVFRKTLEICEEENIRPHLLPALNDIDTIDDLKQFMNEADEHNRSDLLSYKYLKQRGIPFRM